MHLSPEEDIVVNELMAQFFRGTRGACFLYHAVLLRTWRGCRRPAIVFLRRIVTFFNLQACRPGARKRRLAEPVYPLGALGCGAVGQRKEPNSVQYSSFVHLNPPPKSERVFLGLILFQPCSYLSTLSEVFHLNSV